MNASNGTSSAEEVPPYCFNYVDNSIHSKTMRDVYITNITLNIAFSITAVFGNLLIMFTLPRVPHLGLPTKTLLFSLALSDFGVGLVVQPFFIIRTMAMNASVQCGAGIVFDLLSGHLSIVTLLTLTAMSMDKFLALSLRLRYRSVVTFKRVMVVVSLIWLIAVPWAMTWLWKPNVYLLLVLTIIPLCIIFSTLAFVKIWIILRHQQSRLQAEDMERHARALPRRSHSINVVFYKRSVMTMFLIHLTSFLCYFPAWVVTAINVSRDNESFSLRAATHLTLTLVLVNSSLNPFLYLWRIAEVRNAAWEILKETRCCCCCCCRKTEPRGRGWSINPRPQGEKATNETVF